MWYHTVPKSRTEMWRPHRSQNGAGGRRRNRPSRAHPFEAGFAAFVKRDCAATTTPAPSAPRTARCPAQPGNWPACSTQPASRASSSLSASSALWPLPRADGRSASSHRDVQCHGGANERLQRLFIDLVALMEIDGTPGVAFEAGVEEA